MNKNKLALVFAGQGSQTPGMGLGVLTSYPKLLALADQASGILGYSVHDLLTDALGQLRLTEYAQPAVLITSILLLESLKIEFHLEVGAYAGFSLGEYSALYAGGVFSFSDIVELIKIRAKAMQQASLELPGSMVAILGMDRKQLDELCQAASTTSEIVTIANLNCPGQIVVSGHVGAIKRLVDSALAVGARRALPLNVSGAFHSPLMRSAGEKLSTELKKRKPRSMEFPLYMNVTASPLQIEKLVDLMIKQLISPVRFEETIQNMVKDGVTHFIEIGPGSVLSGFIKKIAPEIPVFAYNGPQDLVGLKGWLDTNGIKH